MGCDLQKRALLVMLNDKIAFWKSQEKDTEDLEHVGICKGSRVALQETKAWIERNF